MNASDEDVLDRIGKLENELTELRNRLRLNEGKDASHEMCKQCRNLGRPYCFLDPRFSEMIPEVTVPKVRMDIRVEVTAWN